jgi:hypothetical protein
MDPPVLVGEHPRESVRNVRTAVVTFWHHPVPASFASD